MDQPVQDRVAYGWILNALMPGRDGILAGDEGGAPAVPVVEDLQKKAVLIRLERVQAEGKRTVLGVSVSLSEAEIHWRSFLATLLERGVHGVKLIVSDDHAGLKQARQAALPSVPWQRCQCHLQQNAQAYVPQQALRAEVAQAIRDIFNAPDKTEAERMLDRLVERYQQKAPKLAEWAQENIPQGLTVFQLPQSHRVRLRTTNGLERLNREIKRRTRVASIFPNEQALLRLASALLVEIDDEWQTGKIYLNMKSEKP